ncbi:SDR family NAD(P)-dependent oxidoreductase [Fluoribacter dumoffii]|uniref:SDR family NAD(P)-dependent oxidoreductase n=1 Tax=Fluoribacter dumoffii TaxID=463 RepID=UPI0022431572|nr:SDR family NAD(P)-dependent oxidoreductase [Fluoribacter dumoffii]MCW8416881.1 SDR family NAD(P)-dependent oxidoreductase [Fluoribacter dumoffii]MCW8455279.1 SDR family NAD(P)-dependent oxidoreductase [Fluoribacter dumoffii]MCW8460643.1 SDR family NAD(P)-dependent oxidoreductase [Fluoribacter dumoffii]MCW8484124.1 SDR family NAD(P)-dependent oxidoreductase [Fluoribacter dumoffii]
MMNILLTGSTGRLGREIVKLLNTPNNKIALHGRNQQRLDELAQSVDQSEVITIAHDLSFPEAAESIIQGVVQHFKGIDVLINNAACFNFGDFIDIPFSVIKDTIQINLVSLIMITRLALPYLVAGKQGMIINIASTAGREYIPGASTYCATKHGIFGFSGSLFEEVRTQGVRVCTIAPGQLTILDAPQQNTIPPRELAQLVHYVLNYPGTQSFPREIMVGAT